MVPEHEIRVGDTERDATAAALGEHYAQGRLDATEFGERLDATYAARTRGDLDRLLADLPPSGQPRGRPPVGRPVPVYRTRPARLRPAPLLLPFAVLPLLWLVVVSLLVAAAAAGGAVWLFLPLAWLWFGRLGRFGRCGWRRGWH